MMQRKIPLKNSSGTRQNKVKIQKEKVKKRAYIYEKP